MKIENKIALIPCYEPDKKLIKFLKELEESNFFIILVNDGSDNEFESIFKEALKYATILKHEENLGKGEALKTGLKYINKNIDGEYIVVTMDSDGQHRVADAIKLYNIALENKNKVILGKRKRSNKTPFRSRIGNNITRFVYYIITGLDIYDTQTGLRAFSNNLVPFMINVKGKRYEYEMNVLLECAYNNIPIIETDIETIYIDNNSGSHFSTFSDSLRVYSEIIKFSISSILSFFVDFISYLVLLFLTSTLGSMSITISNILARIISSCFNYIINKRIVFKSKNSVKRTVILYYSLVIFILILNTLILNLLVSFCNINQYISKIITEIILFVISWIIQKHVIFNEKEGYEENI